MNPETKADANSVTTKQAAQPWSNEENELSQAIAGLVATRPWILFFGVTQLIALGIHVFAMFTLFESAKVPQEALYIVGALELVFITISVYSAIKLFEFSDAIQVASARPSLRRVTIAIRAQWRYWRFLGF
jgi:hypothetical protein